MGHRAPVDFKGWAVVLAVLGILQIVMWKLEVQSEVFRVFRPYELQAGLAFFAGALVLVGLHFLRSRRK